MTRTRLGAGLVLAGAALAAGMLALRTSGPTPVALRYQVRQAYLGWWGARQAAFLRLDPTPLQPYTTAAGRAVDDPRMAALREVGHLLRLAADHNTQIVVYAGGDTASVDDVWADHSVELDPTTMTPIQPDPDLTVHESTTLRRAGGRWLVDGVWRFGVSHPLAGEKVSWAAVTGGQPLPDAYGKPIEHAYLAATPQGFQHNVRIAIQQDSVAWAYDTTSGPTGIAHSSTRLVQEAVAWKRVPAAGP